MGGLLEQQRSRSYSCLPSTSQQSSSSSRGRRRENEAWTSTLPLARAVSTSMAREKRTVRRLRRAPSQVNIIHLCHTTLYLSFIAQGLEKVHENPTLENALIYIKIYVDAGKHGGHNCTSKPGADLPRKPTRPHPIILEVG